MLLIGPENAQFLVTVAIRHSYPAPTLSSTSSCCRELAPLINLQRDQQWPDTLFRLPRHATNDTWCYATGSIGKKAGFAVSLG